MRCNGDPSHSFHHTPASAISAPPSGRMPRPQPQSRRHAAPRNTASSTPTPTTRPAQTGPRADFGWPIVLGVNLGKGVYVVRQLTPSLLPSPSTAIAEQQRMTESRWRHPREPDTGSRDLRRASQLLRPCEPCSQGTAVSDHQRTPPRKKPRARWLAWPQRQPAHAKDAARVRHRQQYLLEPHPAAAGLWPAAVESLISIRDSALMRAGISAVWGLCIPPSIVTLAADTGGCFK